MTDAVPTIDTDDTFFVRARCSTSRMTSKPRLPVFPSQPPSDDTVYFGHMNLKTNRVDAFLPGVDDESDDIDVDKVPMQQKRRPDATDEITPTQPFDSSDSQTKRLKTIIEVEELRDGEFTLSGTNIVLEGVGEVID